MEDKCILTRKALLLICLFESWIKQFHKEKKIKYVLLMDIFFSLLVSLILAITTYFIMVLSLFIFIKRNDKNILNYFYFSSFIRTSLIYFTIIAIIAIENLFDEKFNIASKFKFLLLALFNGVTVKKLKLIFVKICLYLLAWVLLAYTISTIFTPFVGTVLINNGQIYNTVIMIMLFSIIIIFLIQVYGINDAYESSRKKVIIYAFSTIIAIITTLNNIQKMVSGKEFSYIFSVECISLTIALVLSVDRLVSSLKNLVDDYKKEYYYTKVKSNCCLCLAQSLTYQNINYNIKIFIENKLRLTKYLYQNFRNMSLLKKLSLFLILAVSICILIKSPKIMRYTEKFQNFISIFLQQRMVNVDNLLEQSVNFEVNYIFNVLLRVISVIFMGIVEICCIFKVKVIYKEISYKFKNIKTSKISYESLHKELLYLVVYIFLALICLIPIASLNLVILKCILSIIYVLLIIMVIIYLLNFIFNVRLKLNEKVNQYKQNNKKKNGRKRL